MERNATVVCRRDVRSGNGVVIDGQRFSTRGTVFVRRDLKNSAGTKPEDRFPDDHTEMIRSILFPIDFGPSCVAMAPYVKRAASIFGAKVTLVHACDLNSHSGFELYARPPGDIAEEHWN